MLDLARIHHIALIASDLDRSLTFYAALGFREAARNYRDERGSWKVDLAHPSGARLELFTFPDAPARPSPEAQGLRHLAFQVGDLDRALATLREAGIAAEPVRTDPYTGARFAFFKDPDGLPLELYEE